MASAIQERSRASSPRRDLREELLKPLGFWQLATEEVDVTPGLAELLAKHFGTTPEFWLNLQAQYEKEMAGKDA